MKTTLWILWVSWAVMLVALAASLAYLTLWIQRWAPSYWIPLMNGISFVGFVNIIAILHSMKANKVISYSRTVLTSVGYAAAIGLVLAACIYILGYFMFLLVHLCWAFLFIAIIYYAIRIARLPRSQ